MVSFDPEVQGGAVCAIVSSPVQAQQRTFGFATFHEETRALRICEYHEDGRLSRSEALLLQVQPRSCCALLDAEDFKKLTAVAESCGVSLSELKSAELKQVDLEQDLLRLLCDAAECGLGRHLEEQRQKFGMRALGALFANHSLLSEPANFGACTLGLYPLKSFMHLDKAAFSALNILPRPDESLRSSTSLFGFLNRCRSDLGMRRLRQWLTQPLTSPEEIARRHDIVEAFCSAEGLLRKVEGHFRQVPDLERLAARLHRTTTRSKATKANLEDVVTLYMCVLSVEAVVAELSTYEGIHHAAILSTLVEPLRACITDFAGFRALVQQTVDLKQAEQRTYCISSSFDASLGMLAGQRDNVRTQMEAQRQEAEKQLGVAGRCSGTQSISLVECPQGQALRVVKKNQQMVEKSKGKLTFKALSIKKNEYIFTTPGIEKLNKALQSAINDYDQQSAQLSAKLLAVAATYCPVVERLAETMGGLDVYCAFARVALGAPCSFVRAETDKSGKAFKIRGASHVLVVVNSEKSFVANDLDMDREASRLHLITGPNMGGKSTYIRSVALIALLHQIGSFVPCQSATLPIFDAVMCRVGASDMQLRGISTFMAEMLEASCILNTATDRSLVIVDELGRGTSTSDGFGIAWAIARHLADNVRCFTLFATHFHELAALEESTHGVRNKHATASVDAASGQLTFLYTLVDGSADQSYGAHVAELAGFPARVVDAARRRAKEFEASCQFGGGAKRQRTNSKPAHSSLRYVLEAKGEEEFVARALEHLPKLRIANGCAGGGV